MHQYNLSNPRDRVIGKVLAEQASVQPGAEWLVEKGRSLTFGEAGPGTWDRDKAGYSIIRD